MVDDIQKPVGSQNTSNTNTPPTSAVNTQNSAQNIAEQLPTNARRPSTTTPSSPEKDPRFSAENLSQLIKETTGKTGDQTLSADELIAICVELNKTDNPLSFDLGKFKESNHYVIGANSDKTSKPSIPNTLVKILRNSVAKGKNVEFASTSTLNGKVLKGNQEGQGALLLAKTIAQASKNEQVVVHYTPAAHGLLADSLKNITSTQAFMDELKLKENDANFDNIKIVLTSTQATRPQTNSDAGYQIGPTNAHYALSKLAQEAILNNDEKLLSTVKSHLEFFIQNGDPIKRDNEAGLGNWFNPYIFGTQTPNPDFNQEIRDEFTKFLEVDYPKLNSQVQSKRNQDSAVAVADSLTLVPTMLHVPRQKNNTVNKVIGWIADTHNKNQAGVMTAPQAAIETLKALVRKSS